MNITKLVEGYISSHPSIKDSLIKGLVNYSSLSRLIMKELKLESKSFDAVLIACRRHQERLKADELHEEKIISIIRKSKLEIKNKIVVAVVQKDYIYSLVNELGKSAKRVSEPFYAIEGSDVITMVTSEALLGKVKDNFGTHILRLSKDLALVTIRSPKELEKTSGVFSVLAGTLAERGINVLETMSCWTDTLFVVEDKDVSALIDAFKL
ncbi:hypothetical protein JXB11_02745 [Candidatus Woesearchaeota archaeon]|nr:hypothetical protein [Candidatus Woesearchaeota archaeon]